MIAMLINRACGGKAEMTEFMPHYEAPMATVDDVMKILSGGK